MIDVNCKQGRQTASHADIHCGDFGNWLCHRCGNSGSGYPGSCAEDFPCLDLQEALSNQISKLIDAAIENIDAGKVMDERWHQTMGKIASDLIKSDARAELQTLQICLLKLIRHRGPAFVGENASLLGVQNKIMGMKFIIDAAIGAK